MTEDDPDTICTDVLSLLSFGSSDKHTSHRQPIIGTPSEVPVPSILMSTLRSGHDFFPDPKIHHFTVIVEGVFFELFDGDGDARQKVHEGIDPAFQVEELVDDDEFAAFDPAITRLKMPLFVPDLVAQLVGKFFKFLQEAPGIFHAMVGSWNAGVNIDPTLITKNNMY